jgi:hypothetical protein
MQSQRVLQEEGKRDRHKGREPPMGPQVNLIEPLAKEVWHPLLASIKKRLSSRVYKRNTVPNFSSVRSISEFQIPERKVINCVLLNH